jgi:hypothetical protein
MAFDSTAYNEEVQAILALDGAGQRPMPLAGGTIVQSGIQAIRGRSAAELFPNTATAEAALAGLYLYFCGYDQAHEISQNIPTAEGSFWHGIVHRQEPDAANAAYWFRRVGHHAIFPALREVAESLGFPVKAAWDPFAFIDYCDNARRKPGSKNEETAMAIQLAEWQLLFDHCARPSR